MKKRVTRIKKYSFSERFKYRFDSLMARGNASMIKMLLLATLFIVAVITVVLHLITPPEERDIAGSFWDALASAVNAWMPYSDDGSIGYILLTALAACTGLLFTSILIGIIASAVEEKVTGLREGNSRVLESGHVVVYGFVPGEYTLIRQLIAAARGKKTCILVAGEQPRSEIRAAIEENVEIPKNVKLICRSVPAGDVAALRVCSLPECATVVINQPDDASTVKAALAAQRLLAESGGTAKIISNVSAESFLLPRDIAADMNVINVSVNEVIARVIAHSCTETGIAKAYTDLFDIEGGGVRLLHLPAAVGKTFGQVLCAMQGAVPLGVHANGKTLLNPAPTLTVGEEDILICWAEEGKEIGLNAGEPPAPAPAPLIDAPAAASEHTLVIGSSPAFETLLRELPEQPNRVTAAAVPAESRAALERIAESRADIELSFIEEDLTDEAYLTALLSGVRHVVILSGDTQGEGDIESILRYIRVQDIEKRRGFDYSVTLELRSEKNLQLIKGDGDTDFIVAPHVVSMFLAQLAACPAVAGVFRELLSNTGSEIHLKRVSPEAAGGAVTAAALRAALMREGMILLGYITGGETVLNPDLRQEIRLAEVKKLIVISES